MYLKFYLMNLLKYLKDKERTMEFDKSRVFTALNADELKAGDKVIVANSIGYIKDCLKKDDYEVTELTDILGEFEQERFGVGVVRYFSLAYLVERKENCINCKGCGDYVDPRDDRERVIVCSEYKPKTEDIIDHLNRQHRNCRPFKDTYELIDCWIRKTCKPLADYEMPLIWIKHKKYPTITLISGFHDTGIDTSVSSWVITWEELLNSFTFLDGSLCGVIE